MSHVANYIKKMIEKDDKFFEPAKPDLSKCVKYVDAQTADVYGKPLMDTEGNPILQKVMVTTNMEVHEADKEL